MLARTLSVLLISSALAGTLQAQAADSIHYSIAPVMEGGALAGLAVQIRFAGDADGETRLSLPREWGGSDSLWLNLHDIRVDGAASVRDDGPTARVITHAPRAPLVVRYRLTSAYAQAPGFGYRKGAPLILPGWFFFHGEGVFAEPEDRGDAPASFAWGAFPAGWRAASDLDHLGRGQRAGTLTDIIESTAIGAPDLTVVERTVGGAPLRVAVAGSWGFAPEAFADVVEAIVHAQNDFWGDPGRAFFVPLAPLGGEGSGYSFSGTARSDAFSIASTPNFGPESAAHLLAHEYMHTWIAAELGGLQRDDERMGYWFSEGWTDFYAGRALLRAGLWTPAEFAAELNETLMRNATSPARELTSAQFAERFWTDAAVQKLPYDRGRLLALLLDHRLRQRGDGRDMDDVMAELRTAARQAEGTDVDAPGLFASLMRTRFGIDVSDDVARHIDRAEPILLPADLFGQCAAVRTFTQPIFHRGFDIEATSAAGNVITGLDPTSPAYAAGLRDGMRIIRRESGTVGDSRVELVYRMDDGGTERIIRYLPEGKETITFQRVELNEAADPAQCARLMSGA